MSRRAPGGLKAPGATEHAKQGGVTLPTGHLVGRAHELAWPVSVVSDRAEISELSASLMNAAR